NLVELPAKRIDANSCGEGGVELLGIPVVDVFVLLVVCAEQTNPQAGVYGQPRCNVPGVLNVWFPSLISVVVFLLRAVLRESLDEALEKVRKAISKETCACRSAKVLNLTLVRKRQ